MLQQSFTFKSKCLEIEDSIHDFKNDKNVQVNLEEILGIKEDSGSERIRICRTCLGYLENVFTELDKSSELKIVIQMCLPEMVCKMLSLFFLRKFFFCIMKLKSLDLENQIIFYVKFLGYSINVKSSYL